MSELISSYLHFTTGPRNFFETLAPGAESLVLLAQVAFGCWVAKEQLTLTRHRLYCVLVLVIIICLQVEVHKKDLTFDTLASLAASTQAKPLKPTEPSQITLLNLFSVPPDQWSPEDKSWFQRLTGRHEVAVLQRLEQRRDIHLLIQEAKSGCTQDDRDRLRKEVLAPFRSEIQSVCREALNATRRAVVTLESSTSTSVQRIEATSQDVIHTWAQTAGQLVEEAQRANSSLQTLGQDLEATRSSIQNVDETLTTFRHRLIATPDPRGEAGLLIKMDSGLNGVNSGVQSLSEFEQAIRAYRLCLAKRIWPFRGRCNALYPQVPPPPTPEELREGEEIDSKVVSTAATHREETKAFADQTSPKPEAPD